MVLSIRKWLINSKLLIELLALKEEQFMILLVKHWLLVQGWILLQLILGKILYSNEKKVDNEFVAKNLSEIFELDYNEVLEKVNSSSSVSTIAKKVDQDKITKLKQWLDEEDITSGINIDDDVKRSYPYNNLAANVIGF